MIKTKPTTETTASAVAIAVFGLDESGKPHAGRFEGADVETARKAADLMKLMVIELNTDALKEVGVLLPAGKLFATGKAFLPFVRQETYDRLTAVAVSAAVPVPEGSATKEGAATQEPAAAAADGKAPPQPPTETSAPAAPSASAIPRAWDEIRVGSLVIGHEGIDEGWWEAIVTEIKGEQLTIRWRDFPGYKPVVVTRKDVAYMPVG